MKSYTGDWLLVEHALFAKSQYTRNCCKLQAECRIKADFGCALEEPIFVDGANQLTKSTLEVDQAVVPFQLNDRISFIRAITSRPSSQAGASRTGALRE